jgi:transposase
MTRVTIAVDLAKSVFQLVVSEESGRISERKRLTRLQFLRFWENRAPCRVLLEACGSAHCWGHLLSPVPRLRGRPATSPQRHRLRTARQDG